MQHFFYSYEESAGKIDINKNSLFPPIQISWNLLLKESYHLYSTLPFIPSTLHQISFHCHELLLGLFPEKSECWNKDIKMFRGGYSRKPTRNQNIEHVFNNLLTILNKQKNHFLPHSSHKQLYTISINQTMNCNKQ